jgi:acylphosphatase
MKRIQITVKGNVQRCGFRNYATQEAEQLGLSGKAVYLDQDIMIEAEGNNEVVSKFVEWCRTGPTGCTIESVECRDLPVIYEKGFRNVPGIVFSKNQTCKV